MDGAKFNSGGLSVFAIRLIEARCRNNISQKALGILIGLDEFSASARMNQYERGRHMPKFAVVERIATALNTPVEYFYARDDVMAEMIKLFSKLPKEMKIEYIYKLKNKNIN